MKDNNQDPTSRSMFNSGNTILFICFLISIGLTIWGVSIYRLTIVNTKYLVVAIIIGAIIVLALFNRIKSGYSRFWNFIIKTAIGGGLFYFLLLFLNQHFASKEIMKGQFRILRTGGLPSGGKGSSCFQPYVIIDFYGIEKRLVFYCRYAETVRNSSKVNLAYSKGLFGFNVIKSRELTK